MADLTGSVIAKVLGWKSDADAAPERPTTPASASIPIPLPMIRPWWAWGERYGNFDKLGLTISRAFFTATPPAPPRGARPAGDHADRLADWLAI